MAGTTRLPRRRQRNLRNPFSRSKPIGTESFKTHGAFSWCELMTLDPKAPKRFYGTLFGGTLEDGGRARCVDGSPEST